jgi:hypothetical protein
MQILPKSAKRLYKLLFEMRSELNALKEGRSEAVKGFMRVYSANTRRLVAEYTERSSVTPYTGNGVERRFLCKSG